MQPSAVSPRPMYNANESRPVKDPKYLAWIRSLPCAICGRKSEAAHTGCRGLSQKASDRRAVPFCSLHHAEYHRIGRRRFERTYRLDIEALIVKLNEKPTVKILGGNFVALLAGEEYNLGPVRKPMAVAVKLAVEICRDRPRLMRL